MNERGEAKRPPPPGQLVGALNDSVHQKGGPSGPAKTAKVKSIVAWLAEAPGHPGVYASAMYDIRKSTMNPHEAWNFPTKEKCEEWCLVHPDPVFVPVAHEFYLA